MLHPHRQFLKKTLFSLLAGQKLLWTVSWVIFAFVTGCTVTDVKPIPNELFKVILNPDYYQTSGEPVELEPLKNDTIPTNFSIRLTGQYKGQVTSNNDGSYTYLPPFRYAGVDTISYLVTTNGKPFASSMYITCRYECVNQIIQDTVKLNEGDSITIAPLANDIICNPSEAQMRLTGIDPDGISLTQLPDNQVKINSTYNFYQTAIKGYEVCFPPPTNCLPSGIRIIVLPDSNCINRLIAKSDTFRTDDRATLIIPFSVIYSNDIFCSQDVNQTRITLLDSPQFGRINFLMDGVTYIPNTGSQGQVEMLRYRINSRRFPNVSSAAYLRIVII